MGDMLGETLQALWGDELFELVEYVRSATRSFRDSEDRELRDELIKHVRGEIGPFAKPDAIQFAPDLPKTRSGKIMRRILRKIAENDTGALGDTSTLADPSVVDDLIANRQSAPAS